MNVLICTPLQGRVLDTFIVAHIKRIPGVRAALVGEWPRWSEDGRDIFGMAHRLVCRFGGEDRPWVARWSESWSVDAFARYLKRKEIDVVLSEWAYTSPSLLEPCRRAGVPLVTHVHGVDVYHRDVLRENEEGYRRLWKEGAAVIYGATAMKDHLVALGAIPERLHYVPCGVDVDQFTPTEAEKNEALFFALSRLADKKGPQLTLLAFAKVAREMPEAKLIAIGEGPLLEACRQMVKALGLQGRAEYLGRVQEDDEVARLMRSGRAFVQHSCQTTYGDAEGTVISVLEASATALPVVATRHQGIADTIIDGETGLLVDEMDIDGMADCMLRLARDPDLAGRLGRAGRSRVVENYSMQRSIDGIHKVLESVTQERKGR